MPYDKTKEVAIQLRLPIALHARIKEVAAREHRSLNAQIIQAIETHPDMVELMSETEPSGVLDQPKAHAQ